LREGRQIETAIVATAEVADLATLQKRLENLRLGELTYYLLQRPDKITDWRQGYPAAADIGKYDSGRLFGEIAEIRWRKTPYGYTLLWLSEGALPPEFTLLGEGWEARKTQRTFLIGGGETKPWRDTRIPRELNYPLDWCKFPKVQVIQYRDLNSQTIRFTRYTHFIEGG